MQSYNFKTMHKPPVVGVDQTPTAISKPGTSKQNNLPFSHPSSHPNIWSSEQPDDSMEMDMYGPDPCIVQFRILGSGFWPISAIQSDLHG